MRNWYDIWVGFWEGDDRGASWYWWVGVWCGHLRGVECGGVSDAKKP